ncbi:hypothetical protein Pla22_06860 [Rubripirellula amarantea]|uniref:Glycosyltransferase RgtA/B/C/D-like domain-containing protein n=2 Tax=Rubripirellula amarantea TaxID=2527999 RepID=A0A5C5WR62_9BACT|nr:hypothetical protein Pla22_06860 [Rubripirellula amarantea]
MMGPAAIAWDAAQYWRLSTLVLSGDLFFLSEPIAYRTPIYPWMLALIRAMTDTYALKAIVTVQGVLYVASAWIASVIAKRVTGLESAQWITLALLLPAVSAITFYATTLSEPLFVFVMMVNSLAVLDYAKHGTGGRAAWMAATFALLILTRPIAILLWVVHLAFLLVIHHQKTTPVSDFALVRKPLAAKMAQAAIAVGVMTLMIAPWIVRNHVLFDKFFLTKFTGRNIWIVTFQDGSGAGLPMPQTPAANELTRRLERVDAADEWQLTWQTAHALVASGLSDPACDDLMKTVATDAIKSDPGKFGLKAVRRIINFWRTPITDLPLPAPEDRYSSVRRWQVQIPIAEAAIDNRAGKHLWVNSVLMLAMITAGVILIARNATRSYGVWIVGILMYFCVVTGIVEIPAYRYRMVVEPYVALLIGSAVAVSANHWIRKRSDKPAN